MEELPCLEWSDSPSKRHAAGFKPGSPGGRTECSRTASELNICCWVWWKKTAVLPAVYFAIWDWNLNGFRKWWKKVSGIGDYRGGKIDLSSGTQEVLEFAIDEARRMGHHYIGTEHLLLGLVRLQEGAAVEVLRKLGVTPEQIRRQTRRVLQGRRNIAGCRSRSGCSE